MHYSSESAELKYVFKTFKVVLEFLSKKIITIVFFFSCALGSNIVILFFEPLSRPSSTEL